MSGVLMTLGMRVGFELNEKLYDLIDISHKSEMYNLCSRFVYNISDLISKLF